MNTVRKTYKENGKIYHADSCKTLTNAWQQGRIQLDALARNNYPGYQLDANMIPGINTIGYWNAQTEQDWGLDWHRNEGIEITFLETGTMPFLLEDGVYTMLPEDLTVTRPWQPHKVGNPTIGIGRLHWLILDVNVRQPHQDWEWPSWIILAENDLKELTKFLRQNEQPILKANSDIKRCFQKIGDLIHQSSVIVESWIAIYVNELLMLLLELYKAGKYVLNDTLTNSLRTVDLFLRELKENFSEPWTLESMAVHVGLGVTRFTHYFKQLTNRTPMQYLNSIRLEAAQKLLIQDPRKSINAICYDCGFSSTQYFSTVFAKKYGCSPSEYK